MKKIIFLPLLFALYVNAQTKENPKKDLMYQYIDPSVKPGDNFYMYANGKWYNTVTIAPTEAFAGARLEMTNLAKARIKQILENVSSKKNIAGSIEQKVGDFFAAGMDSVAIEKLGYTPIEPWLKQIEAIKDIDGLLQFVSGQLMFGYSSFIGWPLSRNTLAKRLPVLVDERNSSKYVACFSQPGLGMPGSDYYLKKNPATQKIVSSYRNYIATLFKLTGDKESEAVNNTNIVIDIETQLATSYSSNAQLRDPQSNYNKVSVADLDKQMPAIGWKKLVKQLHIEADSLNICQPAYYSKLNELLSKIPLSDWKIYLRFHLLKNVAPALSSPFVLADFEYNGKSLRGQAVLRSRWDRISQMVDANLGEALGRLYVEEYFSPQAKQRMQELVDNLLKAFENRINHLEWMSDSTKQQAIAKLHTTLIKIGYPDKWQNYQDLIITRHNFFSNLLACKKYDYDFRIKRIGKVVDKSEWELSSPTVNAYSGNSLNEIVFPAGYLQYPFFALTAEDALNYGGIGRVIGHEIIHGFDDEGAQYDRTGNLRNWWTKGDYDKFKSKTEQVVNLYNGFTVLDSLHINGRLTLGENTADIGGLAIAYDAFKMTKQGQDTVKINGLTPDQRFFLSFAQCARDKQTEGMLRLRINIDTHSPNMYRVLGPLMNFTPFYNAFNVKEGDKMFLPEKGRIHVW